MTRFQISFVYSIDAKRLTVYVNKTKKLTELTLNLDRLDDLSITLSSHPKRGCNGGGERIPLDDDEFNIDEIVYLLVDEITNQHSNATQWAMFFKRYLLVSNEFKRKLAQFLLQKCDESFEVRYKRIYKDLDLSQLKEHWLRLIDQSSLTINESSLTSLNTLGIDCSKSFDVNCFI